MNARNTDGGPPFRSDLPEFALPVTTAGKRSLDVWLCAHPLPFPEYLNLMTRWSNAWVTEHGQRGPDEHFDRPFEL